MTLKNHSIVMYVCTRKHTHTCHRQSGWMWKIMAQPGLAARIVQPVASCYTDYALLAAVRSWINSGSAFCYLLDKLLVCISVYQSLLCTDTFCNYSCSSNKQDITVLFCAATYYWRCPSWSANTIGSGHDTYQDGRSGTVGVETVACWCLLWWRDGRVWKTATTQRSFCIDTKCYAGGS